MTTPKFEPKKYIIAADITTTAPMHITAIEKGSYDAKIRRLYRHDSPTGVSGIGCSLTRTMAIISAARTGEDGKHVIPRVPVIPASTFAGKLRRAVADRLFDSFIKRGICLSPNAYNTMTSGTATTDLKSDAATHETMRAARNDPFFSLFGGTSFALKAGSIIGEGWPLLEITKDLPMTEPIAPVSPLQNLWDLTDALAIVKKNDVVSQTGAKLEAVVGVPRLIEYLMAEGDARVLSKEKKASKEVGAKKTDLRTLNAVEAVRTGLSFALRVEVTARSPAHLGVMLLGVQSLLQANQIGGKGSRGMGTFVCSGSRLYELDPSNRQTTIISTLFDDKASGYAFKDAPIVQLAVIAGQDYIDAAQAELFEAFAATDAEKIKTLQA